MFRAGDPMWNYIPPLGGTASPYRLGDFRGYLHEARPPFYVMPLQEKYYNYGAGSNIATTLDMNMPGDGELSLSDIGNGDMNIGVMYPCVAIVKQGTALYQYKTGEQPMSDEGAAAVEIPIASLIGLTDGAFYEVAYLFARNKKTSIMADDIENAFIPLPGGYFIVQTVTSSTVVRVMGHLSANGLSVEWDLYISNTSPSSVQLLGCYVYIRYADNDVFDPMEMGEDTISLGTITVPAGQSHTYTNTFIGVIPDNEKRGGRLWFRNQSNSLWNTSSILEDLGGE
jgi:hypothetical protein